LSVLVTASRHYRQQDIVVEDQVWSADMTPQCGSLYIADRLSICLTAPFTICAD